MQRKILFIDRDGTLIAEPKDFQVDSYDKFALLPGVIPALLRLKEAGFDFVMVTNQDGLGTRAYLEEDFNKIQELLIKILASQNINFEAVRICPHFEDDQCGCRKPKVGLVLDYLQSQVIDRADSYVIGDRVTDLELASNLGISGIQIGLKPYENWEKVANSLITKSRSAKVFRKTTETQIELTVDLDAQMDTEINTQIPFFDHMLEQLAKHGGFGLKANIRGDINVDDHHTVEDTSICLGMALKKALGDKRGIGRYGFVLPMDEAQAQACLDLSGRANFQFEGSFDRETIGDLSTECVPHFFQSLAQSLEAALHIRVSGQNTHHKIEAMFKAVGKCLRQATIREGVLIPSTKGIL